MHMQPEETNADAGKNMGGSIKIRHGFVCAADRRLGISRRACAESADRMTGQNCRNPAFRRTAVRPAALSVPFYAPFNGRHCRGASFSVTASAMGLLLWRQLRTFFCRRFAPAACRGGVAPGFFGIPGIRKKAAGCGGKGFRDHPCGFYKIRRTREPHRGTGQRR